MGSAASTAETRLEVNELSTWSVAEVAHVRAFFAREQLPFSMGEEDFIYLLQGAGLSSKNVYGRISTVTTLPTDLWHVYSTEGGAGEGSDEEEEHETDETHSETPEELQGFVGAGAAAARAAAAKAHGLPPPVERCAVNALELFAGLTVYARGDADAKLEVLFDLADVDGDAGAITFDEVVLLLRATHGGVARLLQRHDFLSADEGRAEQLARACFARTGIPLGGSIQKPRFVKWGMAALFAEEGGACQVEGVGAGTSGGDAKGGDELTLEGVVHWLSPPARYEGAEEQGRGVARAAPKKAGATAGSSEDADTASI